MKNLNTQSSTSTEKSQLGLAAVRYVTSIGASAGLTASFVEKTAGLCAFDVIMSFRDATGGEKKSPKRHLELWKDLLLSYDPSLNVTESACSIFFAVVDHGAVMMAGDNETFSTDTCYVLPAITTPGNLTSKMNTNFRIIDVDGDHLITPQKLV